jgi:hypothetical protein
MTNVKEIDYELSGSFVIAQNLHHSICPVRENIKENIITHRKHINVTVV